MNYFRRIPDGARLQAIALPKTSSRPYFSAKREIIELIMGYRE
jgi:hypothetical protein